MQAALVTVVVVTWNARAMVIGSLDGLARQTLDRGLWDVLVVDNDSSDGTAEALATHPLGARVLKASKNLGFAGGAHLGIGMVQTPYVVLLNNDAVPEPRFLSALLAAATDAGAQDVAAITARVLLMPKFTRLPAGVRAEPFRGDIDGAHGVHRPDPSGQVDILNSTGNLVSRQGFGRDRSWGLSDAKVNAPGEVFAFCGAAALLRMAALREVGDFDPDLFLYYEDTDLSWRLRAAGWRIRYEASAVVRHHHGASSDVSSPFFRFHDDRNRLLVLTKNGTIRTAAAAVLRYPATVGSLTLHLGPRRAMTFTRIRAFLSYLRLAPRMLRRRRHIRATAVVPPGQLTRLLEDDR